MDHIGTENLICYYPKYEYLDNIISSSSAKKINIFVDLKGCIQSLYQEWAVRYLIEQSKGTQYFDSSLFFSFLEFVSFHKKYAKKRDIELNMYFFMERGQSAYHINIYPKYKEKRGDTLSFLKTDEKEFFHLVLNKNFDLITNIGNKIPGVTVIKLEYLEADFIPYYVRKHILGPFQTNEIDVIYSIDKDMLQCLDNPNTYIFYRNYKDHKNIDYKNAYSHYFKKEWTDLNIGLDWFPICLAINGDASDEFCGIKGLGQGFLYKNFKEIVKLFGNSTEEMYKRIINKTDLFDKELAKNNKNLLKLVFEPDKIIRNIRLSSYKLLSDYLNSGYPLETIKKNRYFFFI